MTKLLNRFFFIFKKLKTYVPLTFHAKIQRQISSGSEEEVDFVIFCYFLVIVAILDI